jgi:hypothetical protein
MLEFVREASMNANAAGDDGNLGAPAPPPEVRSSKGLPPQVVVAVLFTAVAAYQAISVLRAIPSRIPVSGVDVMLVLAFVALPWVFFVPGYRRAKTELVAAGSSPVALTAIQRFGYSALAVGYMTTIFILMKVAETLRLLH